MIRPQDAPRASAGGRARRSAAPRRASVDRELPLVGGRVDGPQRRPKRSRSGRQEGVGEPAAGVVDQDVDRAEGASAWSKSRAGAAGSARSASTGAARRRPRRSVPPRRRPRIAARTTTGSPGPAAGRPRRAGGGTAQHRAPGRGQADRDRRADAEVGARDDGDLAGSDLDDVGHDHRAAAVRLVDPAADRAAHDLLQLVRVGDAVRRRPGRSASVISGITGVERGRVLGEALRRDASGRRPPCR